MGADPDAARRDVAQQGVEIGAISPVLNRVNPDQHAIDASSCCRTSSAKLSS